MATKTDTPAGTATTTKTRATKRNFSGQVAELKTWASMYLDVLTKVGGEAPNDFTKGQQDVLKDVLAKLK